MTPAFLNFVVLSVAIWQPSNFAPNFTLIATAYLMPLSFEHVSQQLEIPRMYKKLSKNWRQLLKILVNLTASLQYYNTNTFCAGTILQCTILHCTETNILYCTAQYLSVLHCIIIYFAVLHCTALYFTALYFTALYRSNGGISPQIPCCHQPWK